MTANNQDSLATFFNGSLLGDDSDDDIDKIKWVTAFNKLSINMTKKDVIKIFDYIDEEHVGYIDRFDFMQFCNAQHFQHPTIKRLKDILISRIEAFLRLSQIGDDESIQIIYSKHTINPCKAINSKQYKLYDPYYNQYYDDDIFHQFDPEEFAMLEIKNCLCCSHCSKQLHSFTKWKKHESKCKYEPEKYIAYLISAVDQDQDITFLDDADEDEDDKQQQFPPTPLITNTDIPPPPDLPPPPPPLTEYVIRYNENEMAEILSQIPDKVPIWSRLFVSTESVFVRQRINALQNKKNKYIKCIKASAYKDYKDILQKKMFDLLLSAPKHRRRYNKNRNGKTTAFKIANNELESAQNSKLDCIGRPVLNLSSYSISSPPGSIHKPAMKRKSSEPLSPTNIVIKGTPYPHIHGQSPPAELMHVVSPPPRSTNVHFLKPTTIQTSKIRYTHNISSGKLVKFKLQNSTTELTNVSPINAAQLPADEHIPKYLGDLEESGEDYYDTARISDTDTNTINNYRLTPLRQAATDNEADTRNKKNTDFKQQHANVVNQGALRSQSSFNLTITQHKHKQNPLLNVLSNAKDRYNIDQHAVGQQTIGTIDSEDSDSSLSELDVNKNKEHNSSDEVSSLSSMTAEDDEEKKAVTNTNLLPKTSGYNASIDMGSMDLHNVIGFDDFDIYNKRHSHSMSLNPLMHSPMSLDSNAATFTSMQMQIQMDMDIDMDVNLQLDESGNDYYDSVIDLILEFSGLSSAIYLDGYLMLHEMVFDVYNNNYAAIWYKYRLNIWLLLLFSEKRMSELEKHYVHSGNNSEAGKLSYIYNLHDMIYYQQTLFTHLMHAYGIPPIVALRSLIWYQLAHNHHIQTDLDIFVHDSSIQFNRSDMEIMDVLFDYVLEKNYIDAVQCVLMKSYLFQPFKHHNNYFHHSYEIQRIINSKNKKKLLPNLYEAQYRDIFYYHILYILLTNTWNKLPMQCRDVIYTFWSEIISREATNEWLFGTINCINKLLLNENKLNHIQYIMSIYLWDGMNGIAILLTCIILIAIHSKKKLNYWHTKPFIQTHLKKICKIYKFVYHYIVNDSDYHDNVSISAIVIKKLCNLPIS